jgi:dipeptidyl aminopeptidase/acylaminoacyl peptidase
MKHFALILLLILPSMPAQQRRFQATDLYAIKDVSDAQVSPDGTQVVFTVSEVSADRNATSTNIWLIPNLNGAPRNLTADGGGTTPRWSPDGKLIAFYASRAGVTGLWIMQADGSGQRLVAPVLRTNYHLKSAGESFAWSPDSTRIAFLTSPESAPDAKPAIMDNPAFGGLPERLRRPLTREEIQRLPPETRELILKAQGVQPEAEKPAGTAPSAMKDDPRVITRLRYKSRTSFSDELQSHIYIVDLRTKQTRQLTSGQYYEHSISWSPKGEEIAFVSNHEADPDRINNTDIYAIGVANGVMRQLTKTAGCEWSPAYSRDGSEIAYLATRRTLTTIDSVAEDTQLFVIPSSGGEPVAISQELDRRVASFKWAEDGKSLLFVAGDQGRSLVYRVTRGTVPSLVFDETVQAGPVSIAANGTAALTVGNATRPPEVFVASENGKSRKLTSFNDDFIASVSISDMRQFSFRSDGLEVEGWVVPPAGVDETKKYPLVLLIHGGPHGMFGYSFNPTVQALTAKGFAVVMINPRGSSGYGQKFSDGCVNDWGGGDYRDLINGIDAALAKFPFLDGSRMGVTGGSYGGYMTNWVVTQTSRFRAGVAIASLSNLVSFYSTSLYQDLIHAEFNGEPWNNYDKLWERSPLAHIRNARTPVLLLHGEMDNDVHITQAEEMFTALRMRGVESVFVRYPREGHGFREPRHRVDSLTRTIDWFEKRLR